MKAIKYIVALIGIAMLIGALYLYNDTNNFLKTAISSNGIVLELIEVRNSSKNSITYKPLVEFTDNRNKTIRFSPSSSSNPPSYSEGEEVEVLYNSAKPNEAKIKSFFSVWGATLILGIIGAILFIIGIYQFWHNKRKIQTIGYLKQNGGTIEADFQSVSRNTKLAVNGRNPFNILTQWLNPETNKLHIFVSDDIWFDPSDFIKTDKIKVLIDRKNPKKYYIDLSFLPQVAE
jgi:hypothetical protein